MNPDRIRRIDNVMSGQAQDLMARLTRGGLRSLEPIYRNITRYRNRRYDRRNRLVQSIPCPVISLGNLTTGGTGKTPLVRWMADWLIERHQKPAIISRGYGSEAGQPNDEYLELKLWLPETPHIQNPDRVAAARRVIKEAAPAVILLDDGFQHRRLGRDLDIVLIDASRPFGYGHLLPRGLLREPVSSLNRADAVVLTRVDQADSQTLQSIRQQISPFIEPSRIAEVAFTSGPWVNLSGETSEKPPKGPHVGFCGIGNPSGFQAALERQQLPVTEFKAFADHHRYSREEILELISNAERNGANSLVCTVKDLVKIRELELNSFPIWAASVETQFLAGQAILENLISTTIPNRNATIH